MYFTYGRYLLISSSRGVTLPANLQGIWNNSNSPAWNSDIHSNINVQMNYWHAEVTNLSDLHTAYTDYIYREACVRP
ncbi:MAG: glycoside hydrolase family 95 protein, partial [Prevotella sp.]|nr:glycoside hydrolase family 95 protein [Prevotella sp.]